MDLPPNIPISVLFDKADTSQDQNYAARQWLRRD
jgi:hypothetical protein